MRLLKFCTAVSWGLEVPTVERQKKDDHPIYSFYRTNPAMDIAAKKFLEIKYLIYELAEIENAVYKIAMEIKPAKGLMH